MARHQPTRSARIEACIAPRALEPAHLVRLSVEDQRRFADAIVKPPAPNKALRRAAKAHKALIAVLN